MARGHPVVHIRYGEGYQQQWYAYTVIEPALDIESLSNARREPRHGRDGLSEGSICGRQQYRQHDSLGNA
jgi:hypothetical protein